MPKIYRRANPSALGNEKAGIARAAVSQERPIRGVLPLILIDFVLRHKSRDAAAKCLHLIIPSALLR